MWCPSGLDVELLKEGSRMDTKNLELMINQNFKKVLETVFLGIPFVRSQLLWLLRLIRYVKWGKFLSKYTHCDELLVHVSSLPFICLEFNVSTIFFSNATSKVEQRHYLSVKGVRFSDLKRQYVRETHGAVRIFLHGKSYCDVRTPCWVWIPKTHDCQAFGEKMVTTVATRVNDLLSERFNH